jgi:hypothetical protein
MKNSNCTAFTVQNKELCQMGKKNGLVFGSAATPKNQLLSVFVKVNKSGKFNLKYLLFCSFTSWATLT